ncbi:MAG TPA: tetratricopeptide repeat protein [bacterium]|nr:tetratricopeptide repeat protein [bacterium]
MTQPVNREILDTRLANGEINAEEYRRLLSETLPADDSADRIVKPDEKALVENLKNGKLEGANLTSINWKKVGAAGGHFAGANLKKAKLIKQDLRDVDLAGANLSGANLTGADLTGANLTGADLSGANLKGATLDKAKLCGADLSRVRAVGSEWKDVDARRANFTQTDFIGAKISDVSMTDAILTEADFSDGHFLQVDMSRADFSRGTMQNAEVNESTFAGLVGETSSFDGSEFRQCSFHGARLPQANFSECRLTNVDFGETDLTKSVFTLSEHNAVELTGATLTGAIFKSLVGYKEEELQALAERGAKVNKFLLRRLGRLILQSTAAKIVALVIILGIAGSIYYYIKTPAYWSFDTLTAEARQAAGEQKFDRAENLYRIAMKKFSDSPERMFSTRLELGNVLLSAKKYDGAAEQFKYLVDTYPADTEVIYAQIGLADVKRMQGNFQEAENILLQVTDQYKDSLEVIDAWAKLAMLAYTQGNVERGNEIYQKIVTLPVLDKRTLREIQNRLAEVLRGKNDLTQAEAIYRDIIENAKTVENSQNAFFSYANMLLDNQRFDDAEKLVDKAVEKFPENKEFTGSVKILVYSRLLDSHQNVKSTIEKLKEIDREAPDSQPAFRAMMSLAQYYRNDKQDDKAEAIYVDLLKRPLTEGELGYEVLMNYAELQTFRGNPKEAIKLIKDLPDKLEDPGRKLSATSIYAEALAADQQYEEALDVLRKVRRKLGNDKQAEIITYYSEAGIHRRFEHYPEAIQSYRQVLKVATQPEQAFQAYMEILATYAVTQNMTERIKVLAEMEKRFKDSVEFAGEVSLQKAQAIFQQGKTAEAIALLVPLVDHPKERLAMDAANTLASLYGNEKKEAELLTLREKFAARFPDNKQGLNRIDYTLGEMYRSLEQFDKAAEIYQRIGADSPLNDKRQAQLSLLQILIDQDNASGAEAQYRQIVQTESADAGFVGQANSMWANYLRSKGRNQEAKELYERMLKQFAGMTQEIDILFELANFNMGASQWGEAEKMYQAIIEKAPKVNREDAVGFAVQGLAEISMMRQDVKSAQSYLEQAMKLKRDQERDFWIEHMKMRILLLQKQNVAAVAAFEQLYQRFPQRHGELEGVAFPLISALTQNRQYEETIKIYRMIIDGSKNDMNKANAMVGLAHVYFEMKQADKGQQIIEQARNMMPEDSPQRWQIERDIANRLLQNGKADEGLVVLQKLFKQSNNARDKAQIQVQIAEVYQGQGKTDEAIKLYRQVIADYAEFADVREPALNNLANLLMGAGREKEAMTYYRRILESSRDIGSRRNAINGLIGVHMQRQNYNAAMNQCNELDKMKLEEPLVLDVLRNKAEIYRQTNRRQQALEIYKRLTDKATDKNEKAQLLLSIGMIYMESQKPKEALSVYQQVLKDPQFDEGAHQNAKRMIADLYQSTGERDKAVALCREIADESSDPGVRIGALTNIAQIYLNQQKFSEAEKIFQDLVSDQSIQDPNQRFEIYRSLGDMYTQANKSEQAVQAYLKARELGKDKNQLASLDVSLAENYVRLSKYEEALKVFQSLIAVGGIDQNIVVSAYNGIAEVYRRQNNTDKAVASYQAIIKKYADRPDLVINTYFTLSNFYGSVGNEKMAIRQYELVVEKFPNHPQAGWAQAYIVQNLVNAGQNDAAEKMARAALKKYPGRPDLAEFLNNILAGIKASKQQE